MQNFAYLPFLNILHFILFTTFAYSSLLHIYHFCIFITFWHKVCILFHIQYSSLFLLCTYECIYSPLNAFNKSTYPAHFITCAVKFNLHVIISPVKLKFIVYLAQSQIPQKIQNCTGKLWNLGFSFSSILLYAVKL